MRGQAAKTRLIRSLQTTPFSGVSSLSKVYASLEMELDALLRVNPLRVRLDMRSLTDELTASDQDKQARHSVVMSKQHMF